MVCYAAGCGHPALRYGMGERCVGRHDYMPPQESVRFVKTPVGADDERCEAQRNECPWGIRPYDKPPSH